MTNAAIETLLDSTEFYNSLCEELGEKHKLPAIASVHLSETKLFGKYKVIVRINENHPLSARWTDTMTYLGSTSCPDAPVDECARAITNGIKEFRKNLPAVPVRDDYEKHIIGQAQHMFYDVVLKTEDEESEDSLLTPLGGHSICFENNAQIHVTYEGGTPVYFENNAHKNDVFLTTEEGEAIAFITEPTPEIVKHPGEIVLDAPYTEAGLQTFKVRIADSREDYLALRNFLIAAKKMRKAQ